MTANSTATVQSVVESTTSFTPLPNDWGKMLVEADSLDDNIVMTGEAGRRLSVENTSHPSPIVLYKAHGMSEFVAEGNLRNPATRAYWAREIAGPEIERPRLAAGIKADLEQAAGEFHKSFTFLTEGL